MVLDEVKCNSVEKSLRTSILTENYAKHTFQAPSCCFENVLTKDLLLVEIINVSIDWVVVKYVISMKRRIYLIERQHKVLFGLFLFNNCEQRK